jgi:hypothetical protein
MPISPAQNGVHESASLPSLAAPDASVKSFCAVVRPAIDSGLSSEPDHWSPSAVARSPPASQMKAAPLRQSWPGNQKPEKLAGFGLACFSLMASSMNSCIVVGTAVMPAALKRSLR